MTGTPWLVASLDKTCLAGLHISRPVQVKFSSSSASSSSSYTSYTSSSSGWLAYFSTSSGQILIMYTEKIPEWLVRPRQHCSFPIHTSKPRPCFKNAGLRNTHLKSFISLPLQHFLGSVIDTCQTHRWVKK